MTPFVFIFLAVVGLWLASRPDKPPGWAFILAFPIIGLILYYLFNNGQRDDDTEAAQQLRQLGDIRRDPSRLIAHQQALPLLDKLRRTGL